MARTGDRRETWSGSGVTSGRRPAGPPGAARWMLVAATSHSASRRFIDSCHPDRRPDVVVTKDRLSELVRDRFRDVRARNIEAMSVHSVDWSRQTYPHIFEILLAIAPVRDRYLIDEASDDFVAVSRRSLARRLALFPVELAAAAAAVGAEALPLLPHSVHRPRPSAVSANEAGRPRSLLAFWRGFPDAEVGGSVTHIAGILGGFRRCGFRVGLLTSVSPPEQLTSVIDDLEVIPPLPRRARITRDVEAIAMNAAARRAGHALARRVRPSFTYTRHEPFLIAGAQIAEAFRIPLVLEWNASELWTRANWKKLGPLERVFTPLLGASERWTVRRASLTVAVSTRAAEMASAAGAASDDVIVVPNGVDVDAVDAHVGKIGFPSSSDRPEVGWIGSFGPWHGAEVVVRALFHLPADVRLVMVGDGAGRDACVSLASTLGVANRIEWTGALPHGEALKRLARCSVLASPHVPLRGQPFFGSPTKLFEYMALGRPIVASRLEQLGEVLEDGRTGRLVPPGDAVALADAIRGVVESPDHGASLGREARRTAESHHTWEHRARVILDRLGRFEPIGPLFGP